MPSRRQFYRRPVISDRPLFRPVTSVSSTEPNWHPNVRKGSEAVGLRVLLHVRFEKRTCYGAGQGQAIVRPGRRCLGFAIGNVPASFSYTNARADSLFKRTLDVYEKALGPRPSVTEVDAQPLNIRRSSWTPSLVSRHALLPALELPPRWTRLAPWPVR